MAVLNPKKVNRFAATLCRNKTDPADAQVLALNDALTRSSVQFVAVRHEQGAAFMADVWGRLTGQAGVCLATLGPGATNLATGLADYLKRA